MKYACCECKRLIDEDDVIVYTNHAKVGVNFSMGFFCDECWDKYKWK